MKKNIESVLLVFDKSLMFGSLPPSAKLIDVNKEHASFRTSKQGGKSSESFWWTSGNEPKFTHFYPDVTAEDIKPNEEFYVYPVFRSLSEVVIPRYEPLDFSKANVLKGSMDLLVGQPIYLNHEPIIGTELGVVFETEWQESYTLESGLVVPSGINARFKIDSRLQPNLAALLQMEPCPIQCVSVTVQFSWVQSHPKMEPDVFYTQCGKVVDGQLVRKVVDEIIQYKEISFVGSGADPFAQKIDEQGYIIQPNKAKIRVSSFSYQENDFKLYLSDSKKSGFSGLTRLSELEDETGAPKLNTKKNMLLNQTTLSALKLGDNPSEADINTALSTFIAQAEQLKAENDSLKAAQTERLSKLQEDVSKNYVLSLGEKGKKSEAILGLIKKSNEAELEALNAEYQAAVEELMPLKCTNCQNTSFSRSSAKPGDSPDGNTNEDNPTGEELLSLEAALAKLKKEKNPTNTKFIHG